MAIRLYKHLQDTLETENQYQSLLETNGVFVALLSNSLDKMDYYTPTDTDYSCRQRILTKIMAKYYNYNLFTDLREYFGNRLLWRLNQIMPTYKAKFNAMLSQSGYESLWTSGVMTESRSGHRYTDIDPTKSYDKTILNDNTTSIDYQSDYPQVITGSAQVTVSGQTYTVNTDFNELGNKNKTTRGGDDKVEHALDEDVNYGEDLTRKFTPEEIAKAKLLFAQLIFNIDEEIVRAVADLFILVDCPFEEDFDVGARMSILDDAKAYTNQKFNESKAYTDQEVAKAKEIVYLTYSATYGDVLQALQDKKLPIYIPDGTDFPKYYYYQEAEPDGTFVFTNGLDWAKCDDWSYWSFGSLLPPQDVEVLYTSNTSYTFIELGTLLGSNKTLFVNDDAGISGDYHRIFTYQSLNSSEIIFSSVYQDGGIHKLCELKFDFNSSVWTYSDYDSSVFYDIDDVTWNDIESAKNNNQTIYLYTELANGTKLYWYLDLYLANTNNNGKARFVQIGGNSQFDIDYQDNQSTSDTLDVHDLFECTYGTTTFAQVTQALSDGKIPVCIYNNFCYVLTYIESSTSYYFQGFINGSGAVSKLKVTSGNVWSTLTTSLQPQSARVTSISSSSTDTQYPSAKCVYDALQNVGGGLFECTYNSTTYAEITQALSDGKLPYFIRNNNCYYYAFAYSSTYYFGSFPTSSGTNILNRISVNSSNVWSNVVVYYELQTNRVTSISSSSTDTQYPSAKCVYDAIQGIIAGQSCATFLIDLSQQLYASGLWTISGVDLTSYSSFTILPYEKENPNWTSFLADNMYIDSSSITASGFNIYSGNSFQGKLRIVAYI